MLCCFDPRCFTFGIGSGTSTYLVEGLAKAGGGTSEFVKEGERMQAKVSYGSTNWGAAHRGYCSAYNVVHGVMVAPMQSAVITT